MAILKLASPLYVNFFHTASSPKWAAAGWKKTGKCLA